MTISRRILLTMRNVLHKRCRENQHTHFILTYIFSPKIQIINQTTNLFTYCAQQAILQVVNISLTAQEFPVLSVTKVSISYIHGPG
jgi:hypothetical protein